MSCAHTTGTELEMGEHVAAHEGGTRARCSDCSSDWIRESLPMGVKSDSAAQAPPSVCMMSTEAGAKPELLAQILLRLCDGQPGLEDGIDVGSCLEG